MSDFEFINDYKFSLGVRELAIVDGTGQILLTINENWSGNVYPRSDGEVAAGIVIGSSAGDIVNQAVPPGDVRRYGAVAGEAATTTASDNTVAIQAALNSNSTVIFQAATYMTGTLFPKSNQIIDLNGATLMLLKDVPFQSGVIHMTAESRYEADVWYRSGVTNLDRVTLKNGILDGNIINNLSPASEGGTYGSSGASGDGGTNGITIRGTTTNIRIENIVAKDFRTDGIAIGHSVNGDGGIPQYITMVDVDLDSNGRQGLSIVKGSDYTFTRCKFRNTSAVGTVQNDVVLMPFGPWAGIDVEPEGGSAINDLRFSDCEFTGNAGKGFLAALKGNSACENWYFDNCLVWGNNNGLPNINGGGNRGVQLGAFTGTITNAQFNNCVMDVFGIGDTSKTAVQATLSSCVIGNKDGAGNGLWCQGEARTDNARSTLSLSGCTIHNTKDGTSTVPVLLQMPNLDVTISGGSITNYFETAGRAVTARGDNSSLTLSGVKVLGFEGVRSGGTDHLAIIGGATKVVAHNSNAGGVGLMTQNNSNTGAVMIVGDCIVDGFDEGFNHSGAGAPDIQLNAGATARNCTTDLPNGVTLQSELKGDLATPEGNVAAPAGSTYKSTTGGAGATMFIKETGAGNTGWEPV